jgi:hypothetical protein|tara:strand:+ start:560 stop:745 length:186 start_codon:yes stop_codon:yes gene_type:complete
MSWLANRFTELRSFFAGTQENDAFDLNDFKVIELKAMAKERGFKGYTGLRKTQLVELLKQK